MKQINTKTGWSRQKDEIALVEEVYNKIKQDNIKFVYFCTSKAYNQQKINSAWKEKLKEVPFFGMSGGDWWPGIGNSAGLIAPEGIKDEGMAAMSVSSDKIKVVVKLIRNLKKDWKKESENSLKEAAVELGLDLKKVDPKKHFGLFFYANSGGDASILVERTLENYYNISPTLLFTGIGAMAFDAEKMAMRPGAIHTPQGAFFEDDAFIVLGESNIPFTIETTANYRPKREKLFKCQEVNQAVVGKLNGQPAAEVYAGELGVSVEDLGTIENPNQELILTNPFGMTVGDEIFVRSAYAPAPDKKSLIFFQGMVEGQEIFLMELTNLVEDTKKTLQEVKDRLGKVEAVIYFPCLWRIKMMQMQNVSKEEMREVLNIAPAIGMHGGGECYGGIFTAATLTLLAFGSDNL